MPRPPLPVRPTVALLVLSCLLLALLAIGSAHAAGSVIAGYVKTGAGAGVAGVSVGLYQGDSLKGSTTTLTNGRYYLLEIVPGAYTVRPVQEGKVFSPASREITVPPDSYYADFVISDAAAGSTIAGTIRTAAGAAVAGVSVGLYQGDSLKGSATSITNGHYYFTHVAAGTYTVRPAQSGKVFDPASRSLTVPPDTTTADFVISDAGSVISGTVRAGSGAGVSGVAVGLYQGDTPRGSTTTNANGRYYFTALADGTYTVRPAQTGKVFDPASRSVTVPPTTSTADFVIGDAVGTNVIAGTIRNPVAVAVANLTVELYQGGALKQTVTTNANGRYYFTHLLDGTYTVRPRGESKVYDPVSRSVTVPASSYYEDFTVSEVHPLSVICGYIRTAAGEGVAEVSLGLYQGGELKATATTIANGRYYFTGVSNGTYVVKPGQANKVFDPVSRQVTVPPDVTAANFVIGEAGSVISGYIKTGAGLGVAGISVGLYQGGELKSSATTITNGRYYFTHVAPGTYAVRPAQAGKVFDPAARQVAVPPDNLTAHFVIADEASRHAISGTITNAAGGGISGLTVDLFQEGIPVRTTTTNSEGRYTFSDLPDGSYVVRPFAGSLVFDPPYKLVVVPPGGAAVDFHAVAATGSAIYGTIRNAEQAGQGGISVGLYRGDTLLRSTPTNLLGRYCFSNVAAGSYTVKPARSGLVFSPATRAVTVPPVAGGQDFTCGPQPAPPALREGAVSPATGDTGTQFTYSIIYSDAANREPARVNVVIDGSRLLSLSKQDANDTNYVDGCLYTVRAMLPVGTHHCFFYAVAGTSSARYPAGDAVVSGPTVTGDELYSVSGVIKFGETRLQGVTVTLRREGHEAVVVTSNAEGRYLATGLAPGTYTVTPFLEGYVFDPPYRGIVLPPSTVTCNFSAVPSS